MPAVPGEVLAAISSEMVRLKATLYGKGPLEAKTYQCDQFIFSVMRGPLSKVELFMVERGRKDLVREFRSAFQEVARHEFCEAVERLTGQKVLTYDSQVLFDPDVVIETFLLEDGLVEV